MKLKIPLLSLILASLPIEPLLCDYITGDLSLRISLEETPNNAEYPKRLVSTFTGPQTEQGNHAFLIALGSPSIPGAYAIPLDHQGSSVYLPFAAHQLYLARTNSSDKTLLKKTWQGFSWSGWEAVPHNNPEDPTLLIKNKTLSISLPPLQPSTQITALAKDLEKDQGWGSLVTSISPNDPRGTGPITLRHYLHVAPNDPNPFQLKTKNNTDLSKIRIYQILPRLFGNTNERRKKSGTIEENGVGKFSDLTTKALEEIKALGITHIWLTGVLQQATTTDYSDIGEPADDPDLIKGLAGSPYAIKDLFDICPDYADNPSQRLEEFKETLGRIQSVGLKAIIDFVPNHVARSYQSNQKPEQSLGNSDDKTQFFSPTNNFFWLAPSEEGPPLQLPKNPSHTASDGLFAPETYFGRVTGDNTASWKPQDKNWYETVKLNYGFDFTTFQRLFPHYKNPNIPIPNTWEKMDAVLSYWQEIGVDGFRADMAHMIPPEFWQWAIGRAKRRNPDTLFLAEAYNQSSFGVPSADPLSAPRGDILFDLLLAGFDGVYDGDGYKIMKNIYDGKSWANDLDKQNPPPLVWDSFIRYAENHDEVRINNKNHWGGLGSAVGKPVSAIMFGRSRGPVILYHGQEVGEPGNDKEGFGEDDGRTTLFDYWSMPEYTKWVNKKEFDGGKLSESQKDLRNFYQKLLHLINEPAFRNGEFMPLNPANLENPEYGRTEGESHSGKYIYAFLRHDKASKQTYLAVVNLHPSQSLSNIRVILPPEAINLMPSQPSLKLTERLSSDPHNPISLNSAPHQATTEGVLVSEIPPLTPYFFQVE